MQRRLLQAFVEAFNPAHPGFVPGLNPLSSVYGARMVDASRTHVYCWDARPYPAFPNRVETWGDGQNWHLGHWLNGRTAAAPIPALVKKLLEDFGFAAADTSALVGTAFGLVVDRIMSAREALQPIEIGFFIDCHESDGRLVFRPRGQTRTSIELSPDHLVETAPGATLLRLTRAQETDLPARSKVTYIGASGDYAQASSEACRMGGVSTRTSQAALGLVLETTDGDAISERLLFEAWSARERATFSLPPSRLALEPGDVLAITANGRRQAIRITEIGDHGARDIEARSIDTNILSPIPTRPRDAVPQAANDAGVPLLVYLDCPTAENAPPQAALVAAALHPWRGDIAVFRSPETSGFLLSALLPRAAVTGLTTQPLSAGAHGRIDAASAFVVTIDRGMLLSVSPLALFGGANTAAIEIAPNVWEILQFQNAELLAPQSYRLAGLLRGQRGTEHMQTVMPGARFVLLDEAVRPLEMSLEDVGLTFNWRAGPSRKDIGDASYITTQQTFHGRGLAPLSPVHVRGARNPVGDVALTWIRRTRRGGDSWETSDAPLSETAESYAIDILAGATVVRTLTSALPQATYTAAQQTADFGSLQSSITIRLAQVSPTYGRGSARTLTL
jgi:Putative phage tail protein/GTA TIM-barrel-like domain